MGRTYGTHNLPPQINPGINSPAIRCSEPTVLDSWPDEIISFFALRPSPSVLHSSSLQPLTPQLQLHKLISLKGNHPLNSSTPQLLNFSTPQLLHSSTQLSLLP